jgi:hypothetical protein
VDVYPGPAGWTLGEPCSMTIASIFRPADPTAGYHPAIAAALRSGWLPGPPDHLDAGEAQADVEQAADLPCERCGSVGGKFVCCHVERPALYRAWSVCRHCDHATEF